MIVSGERRYKASKIAGLRTIKAHLIYADENRLQELALIENIQRDDLSDLEKAKFIGKLWASGNYKTKKALATAIGKTQAYISKAFSSLKLDESILSDIEQNKTDISISVLDEISRIKDQTLQADILHPKITQKPGENKSENGP